MNKELEKLLTLEQNKRTVSSGSGTLFLDVNSVNKERLLQKSRTNGIKSAKLNSKSSGDKRLSLSFDGSGSPIGSAKQSLDGAKFQKFVNQS